ncbi:MAG: O-antigen ligase family protein [Burkholderiaceae bacterium]
MAGTLRIDYARKTVQIIASSPWVGYGTGSFPQVYETVAGVPWTSEFFTYHPHFDLMLYWVEAGIAGVLAVLLLYAGLLRGRGN